MNQNRTSFHLAIDWVPLVLVVLNSPCCRFTGAFLQPSCAVCAKLPQSCPTLCNCMDCKLPDSSAHRIHRTRILKWVVSSFSRGSSPPRDQTQVSYVHLHWQAGSLPLAPPGKPHTSPVGQGTPLKAYEQGDLQAQCEDNYEEIKVWESGRWAGSYGSHSDER